MTATAAQSTPKPLGGVRAVIAKRMHESLQESAQLTYFADADVTRLLDMRRQWKADGKRIGIEDCIIAAIAGALIDFPEFNATLNKDGLAQQPQLDVSIAISSPSGLVTPVLRDAGAQSLEQIAENRRDLVERALASKLKVSEMKGGTFTISNLGLTRVRHFTPILNRPQVALLGIGRIERIAAEGKDGSLEWRDRMGLSLTADHRVLDGDPSGRFLGRICNALERIPFS